MGQQYPILRRSQLQHGFIGGTRSLIHHSSHIVTGRTRFGIDAYFAGALTAVILRSPYLDGTLDTLDDSEARQVAGVRDVIHIPGPKPDEPFSGPLADGVAVLAENTWAAVRGRNALKVTWKQGPWSKESTSALAAKKPSRSA